MKTSKDGTALRPLSTLFNLGVIHALTDGQLLERFTTGRGEVAELAFAALVERHGALVMRVCRALSADPHDAQDAFQATFLVLVKKARALWVRDSLGPWLYGVAVRTASCARSAAARRRKHERRRAESAPILGGYGERISPDLERVLHEEIARLPERYRVPIVLCDLEGRTCEEAARRMGRPVGTVKSWRARGRERLRSRLTRLGLAPSAGLVAALAAHPVRASVPRLIAEETVWSAVRYLSGSRTVEAVSASVMRLVNGVLGTMRFSTLRTTLAAVFALGLAAAGVGAVAEPRKEDSKQAGPELPGDVPRTAGNAAQVQPASRPSEHERETWNLSLREAIRIGLRNSKSLGGLEPAVQEAPNRTYVIGPPSTDVRLPEFKAELMALVRSIEQRYWALAQQHVQLGASERAIEVARGIATREQAELQAGRGNDADVAEAEQRLEQFRLDLVTKSSDVITAERHLRDFLGLPPADNRRIVPATDPTEALVEPDRETCKAAMLEKQPDVWQAKVAVAAVDVARDGLAQKERKQAVLKQVIDQTTRSLDRFIQELDGNYQQFRTARRLRAAAAQRLESQRPFYEEHRIPIGRYLDAVSQYASAVAQEAHFKTSYNISIVALEEAKGTLLEHDQITVSDRPTTATGFSAGRDDGTNPMPLRPANPSQLASPDRLGSTGSSATVVEKDEGRGTDGKGKTVSFQFTVGSRSNPIEIRGSFTIRAVPPGETSKAR